MLKALAQFWMIPSKQPVEACEAEVHAGDAKMTEVWMVAKLSH